MYKNVQIKITACNDKCVYVDNTIRLKLKLNHVHIMSSCNSNSCSTTTNASCATSCATSCTCCHVKNVTIDKQLCVGDETHLRTSTSDGGALLVQNGCCPQTSGVLAHICGESGQVALKSEKGKVQIDPGESLSDNTMGVSIYNSTTQTNGELVKITGDADQTALAVLNGKTQLISNSGIGNALYIANQVEQTNDELVLIDGTLSGQSGGVLFEVDGISNHTALRVKHGKTELNPHSEAGGALIITNTSTQSSGEMVSITGSAGKTALKISEGQTIFDPNASDGGALIITNSNTQNSGVLTHIEGTNGQMALQVDNGNVQLDNVASANAVFTGGSIDNTPIGANTPSTGTFSTLSITGGLDNTPVGSTTPSTGAFTTLSASSGLKSTVIGASSAASGTFTSVHIDPNHVAGGGLTVSNTATQSSGNLVEIQGAQDHVALHFTDGEVMIDSTKTDHRAVSNTPFSAATAGLKVRGGLAVDGTESTGLNYATLDLSGIPTIYGGAIVNGGTAVGGSLWTTPNIATETATEKKAGLLVGGGAIIEKNLILVPSSHAPAPTSSSDTAGAAGEIRVHGQYMYLYTGSEWRRTEFSAF